MTAPDYDKELERAGITPDDPLYVVLVRLNDAMTRLEGKIDSVSARALSPAAEKESAFRIAAEVQRTINGPFADSKRSYVATSIMLHVLSAALGALFMLIVENLR